MSIRYCRNNFLLLLLFAYIQQGRTQSEENDSCQTDNYEGICAVVANCPHLQPTMDAMQLTSKDVGHCGYNIREEIICCPNSVAARTTTVKPPEFTTMSSKTIRDMLAALPANERAQRLRDLIKEAGIGAGGRRPAASNLTRTRASDRPADRACREIEKDLMPNSVVHILGGEPVAFAEYPHVAKIVYDTDDVTCGGTLIDKRFVLTAAHCIETRGSRALKVILGVTDFNDVEQWQTRLEIDIKATYVHENYSSFFNYFDIGLIELAKDAEYSVKVYPTCLHTDLTDLPDNTELIVTGWGVTENKTTSARLLAAKLNAVTLAQCNISYADQMDRHLLHGIDETQLCAFAPGRDACWGDSGGPLHLVKDKSFGNYRVVGVVSFGLLCGTKLPGVYTRVEEFLDFIESIVWPDG
ncbi:PREDICTED: serine protease persephone-like isoform X1 [Rhagoletis zephyria]|uniref:serine protease persephone-like isoform X1 n=1 Tax=Rhagoletis zephyria TaxID=28612 RepID=UPI00081142B0|nr:PREDICTED: serine protease persephone-like isoform X1 [Rhagoletis zephyria]XP_017477594.1 PREDICTED: serine protease persephone-like isoform X1 [Rhagoletis zephyria]XP_017477595.1 PREDICTED: serine protease persephone-like isoform X1 [Rhagoletis zephyria]